MAVFERYPFATFPEYQLTIGETVPLEIIIKTVQPTYYAQPIKLTSVLKDRLPILAIVRPGEGIVIERTLF